MTLGKRHIINSHLPEAARESILRAILLKNASCLLRLNAIGGVGCGQRSGAPRRSCGPAALGLRAVWHKGTAKRNGLPCARAWCLAVSMAMSEFVPCSFSLLLWVQCPSPGLGKMLEGV